MKVLADARKAKTAGEWGDLVTKRSADAQPKGAGSPPPELSGELGLVTAPGEASGDNPKVPPEVRAAIFEVKGVGEVLDRVVPSKLGFHVLRMTAKNDAHERSYAEAERGIRVRILQDKINAREKALEIELRKQFPVVVDDKVLATVVVPGAPAEEAQGAGTARPAGSATP